MRPTPSDHPHRLDLLRHIGREQASLLCPPAQPPEGFEAAIDGRRLRPPRLQQILAVPHQIKGGESLERGLCPSGADKPPEESLQVVTIAPERRRREVFQAQTLQES